MILSLRRLDRGGLVAGMVATALLAVGIVLGSRSLRHFDPVLLTYTFGVLFSVFAVAYRTAVWLQRPPTRLYARRGWQLLWKGNPLANLAFTGGRAATHLGAQKFILRRGRLRWFTHFLIAWGSVLAGAVTFPLVFGWLHFESRPDDPAVYEVILFSLPVASFRTDSLVRFLVFNLLNVSAVMVILGAAFSLHRRLRNEGSAARQQFGNDLLPLLLLLAISVTGLLLTFSMHALGGAAYPVLSLIHAVTVSATLLYIPFGKFFHIFQRPLQIGVILHHRADQAAATCRSCGDSYAGARHVEDLKTVMVQSGFQGASRLELCPRCKRRELGTVLSRAPVEAAP